MWLCLRQCVSESKKKICECMCEFMCDTLPHRCSAYSGFISLIFPLLQLPLPRSNSLSRLLFHYTLWWREVNCSAEARDKVWEGDREWCRMGKGDVEREIQVGLRDGWMDGMSQERKDKCLWSLVMRGDRSPAGMISAAAIDSFPLVPS